MLMYPIIKAENYSTLFIIYDSTEINKAAERMRQLNHKLENSISKINEITNNQILRRERIYCDNF